MTDELIRAALSKVESSVNTVLQLTHSSVTAVKDSVRDHCVRLKEETGVRISAAETVVIRSAALVSYDADYHLLRAYFHASPSLMLILAAVWGFITTVIDVINVINGILKVITGETLAYWLDKLIPGFQQSWRKLMSNISDFSALLGWGVDGVHHLLNVANTGADLYGMISGKDRSSVNVERYKRTDKLMNDYSTKLQYWQKDPGRMIWGFIEEMSYKQYKEGQNFMIDLFSKLEDAGNKVETLARGLGDMTSEFLSLRNDMPAFIAKNIPQALWDAVGWADTMINDRLLPRLDVLTDKLNEIDKLLDSYTEKTSDLVKRIARPGDLLAEISSLPDYIRKDQEDKIDDVASRKYNRDADKYEIEDAAIIAELERVSEAMKTPFPSPSFLMLEEIPRHGIPVPGAVSVETWFVGDY